MMCDDANNDEPTTRSSKYCYWGGEEEKNIREKLQKGLSLNAFEQVFTVDEHNQPTAKGHTRAQVRLDNMWHRATYVIIRHEGPHQEEEEEQEEEPAQEELDPEANNNNNSNSSDNNKSNQKTDEEDNIHLLIQRRSKLKDYCPGRLDPAPGGVVEFGESYEDNAIREMQEEMGIELLSPSTENDNKINGENNNSNEIRYMFTFPYEDERLKCWGALYEVVYRGRFKDLTIQKEEVDEVIRMSLGQCRLLMERLEAHTNNNMLLNWTPDGLHALKLYLQYRLDRGINRRLLKGYSSGDLDNYRLRPKPQAIFFDCDDCLYFDNWTVAQQLTKKIDEWFTNHGLPQGEAYKLYKQHGTALRGLLAEGHIAPEDKEAIDKYLQDVHDIPIEEILQPDPELRAIIQSIDPTIPKYIFTASVHYHAERCLKTLGIDDLFDGIIDVKACDFETKHSQQAFLKAMEIAGITDPESCIFLDDSLKNIQAAQQMKWRSILVGRIGRDCGKPIDSSNHAEQEVDRIHDISNVLPELFK